MRLPAFYTRLVKGVDVHHRTDHGARRLEQRRQGSYVVGIELGYLDINNWHTRVEQRRKGSKESSIMITITITS